MLLSLVIVVAMVGVSEGSEMIEAKDALNFLKKLHTMVMYGWYMRDSIDTLMAFSMTIINYHLKNLIYTCYLNKKYMILFHSLVGLVRRTLIFFAHKVQQDTSKHNHVGRLILSLFMDDTRWIDHQKGKFLYVYNDKWRPLNFSNPKWKTYQQDLYEFKNMTPTPFMSDRCLVELSNVSYYQHYTSTNQYCKLSKLCDDAIYQGSNFGFAVTHRILLLIMAAFGRMCYVTYSGDVTLVRQLCDEAYDEARYGLVVKNHSDLLLEQTALCGIYLDASFLNKSLVHIMMERQVRGYGCFSTKDPRWNGIPRIPPDTRFQLIKREFSVHNGRCNIHSTAMGAMVLALCVRYRAQQYDYYYAK